MKRPAAGSLCPLPVFLGLVEDTGFESEAGQNPLVDRTAAQLCQNQRKSLTQKGVTCPPTEGAEDSLPTTPEQVSDTSLRKKCALCVRDFQLPADLARVMEAWPDLPQHIRAAILALVKTTEEGKA